MKNNTKEDDVLKFIKKFMLKNGYTPTIRDIGFGVGLKSTSSVQHYFDKLVSRGDIVQHGRSYAVKGMKYVDMSVL